MEGTPEEVFSHPDELTEVGLSVPEPTSIAMALREKGVDLGSAIYTTDQLVSAITRWKGGPVC